MSERDGILRFPGFPPIRGVGPAIVEMPTDALKIERAGNFASRSLVRRGFYDSSEAMISRRHRDVVADEVELGFRAAYFLNRTSKGNSILGVLVLSS